MGGFNSQSIAARLRKVLRDAKHRPLHVQRLANMHFDIVGQVLAAEIWDDERTAMLALDFRHKSRDELPQLHHRLRKMMFELKMIKTLFTELRQPKTTDTFVTETLVVRIPYNCTLASQPSLPRQSPRRSPASGGGHIAMLPSSTTPI